MKLDLSTISLGTPLVYWTVPNFSGYGPAFTEKAEAAAEAIASCHSDLVRVCIERRVRDAKGDRPTQRIEVPNPLRSTVRIKLLKDLKARGRMIGRKGQEFDAKPGNFDDGAGVCIGWSIRHPMHDSDMITFHIPAHYVKEVR